MTTSSASDSPTSTRRRASPYNAVPSGRGANGSLIIQPASSSFTSPSLPGAGTTVTAKSCESSPLKSPTAKEGAGPVVKAPLKMRPTAPPTSAASGGGCDALTDSAAAGITFSPGTVGADSAGGGGASATAACRRVDEPAQAADSAHAATTDRISAGVKVLLDILLSSMNFRRGGPGAAPVREMTAPGRIGDSERLQERDDLCLLLGGQRVEGVARRGGLPRVALDRLVEGERQPVMHQQRARAHAPERRRAE